MKKALYYITILISFNIYAQTNKAVIEQLDGKIEIGFAEILESNPNKIRFRKDLNSRPKKLDSNDFVRLLIYKNGIRFNYEFKINSNYRNKIELMRVIKKGFLSLYAIYDSVIYNTHSSGEGFGNINIGMEHSAFLFFISKKGDKTADKFPTKNAAEYFKDCPELVKKIKNKDFKSKDYFKIVDFYNNNCAALEKP